VHLKGHLTDTAQPYTTTRWRLELEIRNDPSAGVASREGSAIAVEMDG
jgi:hypothetical protein